MAYNKTKTKRPNNEKTRQIGMNIGTAYGRLRKLIMFKLLKEANKNVCYRCGELIEKPTKLSIDHKIPYLHAKDPKDLFWDLNNVAFSHLKCNVGAARQISKKLGPPGTSWCHSCEAYLPEEVFVSRYSRWNGLDFECKKCKNERYSKDKNIAG